jgi:hypothetical protein
VRPYERRCAAAARPTGPAPTTTTGRSVSARAGTDSGEISRGEVEVMLHPSWMISTDVDVLGSRKTASDIDACQ